MNGFEMQDKHSEKLTSTLPVDLFSDSAVRGRTLRGNDDRNPADQNQGASELLSAVRDLRPVDAIPDTSQQMLVFMMWCLPLSLIVLAVVWLTRSGTRTDGGAR
jgi:hypothetical protein